MIDWANMISNGHTSVPALSITPGPVGIPGGRPALAALTETCGNVAASTLAALTTDAGAAAGRDGARATLIASVLTLSSALALANRGEQRAVVMSPVLANAVKIAYHALADRGPDDSDGINNAATLVAGAIGSHAGTALDHALSSAVAMAAARAALKAEGK